MGIKSFFNDHVKTPATGSVDEPYWWSAATPIVLSAVALFFVVLFAFSFSRDSSPPSESEAQLELTGSTLPQSTGLPPVTSTGVTTPDPTGPTTDPTGPMTEVPSVVEVLDVSGATVTVDVESVNLAKQAAAVLLSGDDSSDIASTVSNLDLVAVDVNASVSDEQVVVIAVAPANATYRVFVDGSVPHLDISLVYIGEQWLWKP